MNDGVVNGVAVKASVNLVRSHEAIIPVLDCGTMKRHPCFVNRNHILAARNRSDDSAARKKVAERQRTPQWRRSELLKNRACAERTFDRPAGAGRFAADDRMEIQEMDCHGLSRLRRVFPVMLHAVRVAPECVDGWCIAGRWNGHGFFGNPRLRDQTRNVTLTAHYRPAEQGPASGGCAEVSMRGSVVWWKQGATTRTRG